MSHRSCADWQAAADYPWLEALSQWHFRDAALCPYQSTIGGPEFATLVLGGVGMAYMIRQGSPAIAFVLFIVTGGVFMSQIASVAVAIVTVVVLTMLGIAPVLVLRRIAQG